MIIKKKMKQFEVPEEGSHLAVLADIEDLGEKMTAWGMQEQVRFKWLLQQLGKDGQPLSVFATFNKSLNEGSNLVQAVKDMTGAIPTEELDTDKLIGINSRLTLKHALKKDGTTFPKVVAILRPAKNDPLLRIPESFKRAVPAKQTPGAAVPAATNMKAAVQHVPGNSNPVAGTPPTRQADDSELPPEPHDLDTGDNATSFPGDDAKSDANAA